MLEYALKQERYVRSISPENSKAISLERSIRKETMLERDASFLSSLRLKFNKLKYGTEQNPTEEVKPTSNEPPPVPDGTSSALSDR